MCIGPLFFVVNILKTSKLTKNTSKITFRTILLKNALLFRCQQGTPPEQKKRKEKELRKREVIKMTVVFTTAIIAVTVIAAMTIICRPF